MSSSTTYVYKMLVLPNLMKLRHLLTKKKSKNIFLNFVLSTKEGLIWSGVHSEFAKSRRSALSSACLCPSCLDYLPSTVRTPLNIKCPILWAAANGVHRNSLAKYGIFCGISLPHLNTALKNRPDEKR